MSSLEYVAPGSIAELLAAFGGRSPDEVQALAGGTDLLVQMRSGLRRPRRIVDLKCVPELMQIETDESWLRIGAAVPAARIAEHVELAAVVPGLVESADLIGSTQIQGRATLGGNLCNASPAADTVPALIALDARCLLAGPSGERELAVSEVVTGPGKTVLEAGEVLIELRIPRPASRASDAYLRLIPRSEMDIAVVGAGVSITLDDNDRCTSACVVLGAVAPTAIRVPDASTALLGNAVDEATLAAVERAARAACNPIDDKRGTIAYRTQVAGVLARRATEIAARRARTPAEQGSGQS